MVSKAYRSAAAESSGAAQAAQVAVAEATARQHAAADPSLSVLLQASAGTGKTRVLVDRMVRLCLAGASARSLLAITFTRKAAAEIEARLLKRARDFARAERGQLNDKLQKLLDRPPTEQECERAAWLFEELLEDPGGLHVGTIHAFCQTLLGRFAESIGLDPHFDLLENEDELWEEALQRLEQVLVAEPDLLAAVRVLGHKPSVLRQELTRLKDDRVFLQRWLERVRGESGTDERGAGFQLRLTELLAPLCTDLRETLFAGTALAGQAEPDLDILLRPAAVALQSFAGAGLDALEALEEAEAAPTKGFIKHRQEWAARAREVAETMLILARGDADEASADHRQQAFDAGRDIFLTISGSPRKLRSFNGKKATLEARQAAFATLAAPFLELAATADLVDLYRRNRALLELGLRALDGYAELKRRDHCVDFQDLEYLAWRLMRDGDLGPWIQYRLDSGIDHVLVDEFQDTNLNQWEILEPLVMEILAGGERPRSLFLVGDTKQSIYGFRGARPELFAEVGRVLEPYPNVAVITLPTNFRSQALLVDSVGALFSAPPLVDLLPPAEAAASRQLAARAGGPSEVFLCEAVPEGDDGCPADERAAQTTAALIQSLVQDEDGFAADEPDDPVAPDERTPIRYRDILVLCRAKTHIAIYEQVLRQAGIPFVPAGRGLLARSREVQDILALLRWLAYPEDDAALAGVLRSPLFRCAEEAVQRVLGARLGPGLSLWTTLLARWRGDKGGRDDAGSPPAATAIAGAAERQTDSITSAVTLLEGWRRRVGRDDVHSLLRRIYRESEAVARFTAALGEQAGFNLLRLLDLALDTNIGSVPSLRRFAEVIERAALVGGEEEGSPAAGRREGRVRLMTVHGAKGLEAPVVILVDAAASTGTRPERLLLRPQEPGSPVLYGTKQRHLVGPDLAGTSLAVPLGAAAAEARERDRREEAHILYVALTRARDRLFVLGAEGHKKGEDTFLDWLLTAAEAAAAAVKSDDDAGEEPGWQVVTPDWAEAQIAADTAADTTAGTIAHSVAGPPPDGTDGNPDGIATRLWDPPDLRAGIELITPSALAVVRDELALPPEDGDEEGVGAGDDIREDARARGERIHLYLELAAEEGKLPAGDGDDWQEVAEVLANSELSWIFHPEEQGGQGLCEVPLLHRLPAADPDQPERRVRGTIDRLVLRPGRADVIDYKSNRMSGDESDLDELVAHYRPQLSAYREAVQALDPALEVNCWLLFTHPQRDGRRGVLRRVDSGGIPGNSGNSGDTRR